MSRGSTPGRASAPDRLVEAMSTLGLDRMADLVLEAIRDTLDPVMVAVIAIDPGGSLELQRFVVDRNWNDGTFPQLDFDWMAPLLGLDVPNGESLVGPNYKGANQIAAAMTVGDGRYVHVVVAGHYDDPEAAQRRLTDIAIEAGSSVRALVDMNTLVADRAALRERERLSRDLHDSLSQSLWSLSMLSETAHGLIDPDDPLHGIIQRISEVSLTSQEEMRSLLINLRTADPTRRTIGGALETLARDFRATNNLEVIACIDDVDLDAEVVVAFQRIAEEALNNVGRHAGASRAVMRFIAHPVPTLRIRDDGAGFVVQPNLGHLGLRIMEERAASIGCVLSVESIVGTGTVISVSKDQSDIAAVPVRPVRKPTPSKRRVIGLASGGLIALVLAGVLAYTGLGQSAEADRSNGRWSTMKIVELQTATSRAMVDEGTVRVLEGVGLASPDDIAAAVARRSEVFDEAQQAITPLLDSERPGVEVGAEAQRFVGSFESFAEALPNEGGLFWLYGGARRLAPAEPEVGFATVSRTDSFKNLTLLEQAVSLALVESIVARYGTDPGRFSPPSDVEDFFEDTGDIVEAVGGFLGPNPAEPLRDGFIPIDAAMVFERGAVAELNRIIQHAELWPEDQWVRQWSPDAEEPPLTLEEYVATWSSALVDVRTVIDDRLDEHLQAIVERRDREIYRSQLFYLAAGVTAMLGAFVLARTVHVGVQLARALAVDHSLDPLTGIGNRRLLESRVEPMLGDPEFRHHAIVTLDMDRFKMVNDSHGHGFGDLVLEVVAAGLDIVANQSPDTPGVAVRMGGDEFLLSMHSKERLDVDDIHRQMRRLRSTLVSADDGTLVRCDFSYGVASAEGSPDLRSLMASSDLAAYGDKDRANV